MAPGTEREAVALDRDLPLAPTGDGADQLTNGEGIEELVGGDQQRAVRGQGVDGRMPGCVGQSLGLELAQAGTRLDEVDGGHEPSRSHRPEGIDGKGAAARPQLDIMRRRTAGALPQVGEREADQLAEHLADLGRGDEIASCAERVMAGVIMVIGLGHEAIERHRPVGGDRPGKSRADMRPVRRRLRSRRPAPLGRGASRRWR